MKITAQNLAAFRRAVDAQLQQTAPARHNVILTRFHKQILARAANRGISSTTHRTSSEPSLFRNEAAFDKIALTSEHLPEAASLFNGTPTQDTIEPKRTHTNIESTLLPDSCPGCGALSQDIEPGSAGYYDRSWRAVRQYLHKRQRFAVSVDSAPTIVESDHPGIDSQSHIDPSKFFESSLEKAQSLVAEHIPIPLCNRCHDLAYNSKGTPIVHPTLDSLADSLFDSPFRRNHVFHILDAADFPMSLIPALHQKLNLAHPRSQNRRSQHDFSRRPTMSFLITRSDLLAPRKEMVDSMLPYFQSALRAALGRFGQDIRLGNLHLVSAKRGWWTSAIKEDIRSRSGGNWMIGKVNVGKSNLFEVLFPKGAKEIPPSHEELEEQMMEDMRRKQRGEEIRDVAAGTDLLPPAQPESDFPVMPLTSSLPGTTASPIRLPFNKHRGELIDLPGLARGNLDDYVLPEHRKDLVMISRPKPEQLIIKSGQSLLLGGGLVRITPVLDPDLPQSDAVVFAYPYLPVEAHVCGTEKAIGNQAQTRNSGIKNILALGAGKHIASAGTFTLETDVTKSRVGNMLRAGAELSRLPFRIYSTDILIEGLGWIELVCQVRKRRRIVAAQDAVLSGADALDFLEFQSSATHDTPHLTSGRALWIDK